MLPHGDDHEELLEQHCCWALSPARRLVLGLQSKAEGGIAEAMNTHARLAFASARHPCIEAPLEVLIGAKWLDGFLQQCNGLGGAAASTSSSSSYYNFQDLCRLHPPTSTGLHSEATVDWSPQAAGWMWVAMECPAYDWGTLIHIGDAPRKRHITEEETRIICDTTEALMVCHSRGVTLGCIDRENVGFRHDGSVLLCGLALAVTRQLHATSLRSLRGKGTKEGIAWLGQLSEYVTFPFLLCFVGLCSTLATPAVLVCSASLYPFLLSVAGKSN